MPTVTALMQMWQFGVAVGDYGVDSFVYHVTPASVRVSPTGSVEWKPVVIQRAFPEDSDFNGLNENPWMAWLNDPDGPSPRSVYLTWYNRRGEAVRKFRLVRASIERFDVVPEASGKSDRLARQTVILRYNNAVEIDPVTGELLPTQVAQG